MNMQRISTFKETQDNWYGSYRLDSSYMGREKPMLVEVIFNGNIGDGVWRTCVWGNDDCGMEFDSHLEAEAWNKFLQVIGMKYVNMADLVALGFISA